MRAAAVPIGQPGPQDAFAGRDHAENHDRNRNRPPRTRVGQPVAVRGGPNGRCEYEMQADRKDQWVTPQRRNHARLGERIPTRKHSDFQHIKDVSSGHGRGEC